MALKFQTKADSTPSMRAEYERLARAYIRLAEEVDRNDGLTIDFELPPPIKH